MKTRMLKGLSFVSLCCLAMAASQSTVQAQNCPQGSCPGYARCRDQDCCLEAGLKWLVYPNYYILPPDYGWNVPTKVPVVRKGVTYYRYWPEQWYGTGGSQAGTYQQYQMIANPTDTTQLGYTYQQVPYWQPNANRVPAPPVPSQWHVRDGHKGYHGRWQNCYTPIHSHQPRYNYATMQYSSMPVGQPIYSAPQQSGAGCPPTSNAAPQTFHPSPSTPVLGSPARTLGDEIPPAPEQAPKSESPAAKPNTDAPKADSPIPMPPLPDGPVPGEKSARRSSTLNGIALSRRTRR